jgi:hypothetical protein
MNPLNNRFYQSSPLPFSIGLSSPKKFEEEKEKRYLKEQYEEQEILNAVKNLKNYYIYCILNSSKIKKEKEKEEETKIILLEEEDGNNEQQYSEWENLIYYITQPFFLKEEEREDKNQYKNTLPLLSFSLGIKIIQNKNPFKEEEEKNQLFRYDYDKNNRGTRIFKSNTSISSIFLYSKEIDDYYRIYCNIPISTVNKFPLLTYHIPKEKEKEKEDTVVRQSYDHLFKNSKFYELLYSYMNMQTVKETLEYAEEFNTLLNKKVKTK